MLAFYHYILYVTMMYCYAFKGACIVVKASLLLGHVTAFSFYFSHHLFMSVY